MLDHTNLDLELWGPQYTQLQISGKLSCCGSPDWEGLCSEDRLVVVLALLKSGALKGRGCMFVGHAQSAHRLRMFLDSFGVRAALCHDAMPANAREHALEVNPRSLTPEPAIREAVRDVAGLVLAAGESMQ